ncbi:hypothetical protein [Planctomicrobium sp. SH664]|uniref:hypothetical protein n=1 Tax=Planctomicrobium sp. SH664 TaxID=3448125 RepID=UPI003F5AEB51
MLVLASSPLPRSELTYVAFRLACLDTRERLELAHQLDLNHERNFGYLTEVPFLKNVPVQVQLDILLSTWKRHQDIIPHRATLLEESVLYATCETAARMIRTEPEIARRLLARGPAPCERLLDLQYADALQKHHLQHAQEGLFLLISQFQDIPPDAAVPLKRKYGLTRDAAECLFEALGRWYVSEGILDSAQGLLTRVETDQLRWLLNVTKCCHPG